MAKKTVKGEAAFDAFVELIEPIFEVSRDEELRKLLLDEKVPMLTWLAAAIKRHKDTFMRTLALLNGQEEKDMTFLDVYNGATELFKNVRLLNLFMPRSQTSATSGSASETTEESET